MQPTIHVPFTIIFTSHIAITWAECKKITEKKQVFYKVKWESYPDSQCTWQPRKNLRNVQNQIDKFQKKNEKRLNEALRNNRQQKANGKQKTTKDPEEARPTGSISKPRKLVKASQLSNEKNKPMILSSDQDKNSQLEDDYPVKQSAESNNEQTIEQIDLPFLEASILELVQKKEQERLRIVDMFKGNHDELEYKVTKGKQSSTQSRDYIMHNHIDQLLAFYQARINLDSGTIGI